MKQVQTNHFRDRQDHITKMREIDKRIYEDLNETRYRYENKFNFNIQDNNAADPEQADWDDIREPDDEA